MRFVHVAPGAPVVLRAGPLFPADDTNIIPCFSTASLNKSWTRLEHKELRFSSNYFIIKIFYPEFGIWQSSP